MAYSDALNRVITATRVIRVTHGIELTIERELLRLLYHENLFYDDKEGY